jgi:plastocyanin
VGAIILSAVACSSAAKPQSSVVVVEAAEQYFNPDQITVNVGTTVVWNDVQGTHDMVADDKSFASAVLFEGGSYAHLFTAPGRYRYVCTLHVGAGMWAEINVR